MNIKKRLRILYKIAQVTAPAVDLSQKSVPGSPTLFDVNAAYPNAIIGLNAANADILQQLMSTLNTALFYSSGGDVDLNWMKGTSFNFGTSSVPSQDLKSLMEFSKAIYNTLITDHGAQYKGTLAPAEIKKRIDSLLQNSYLNKLPSTNTTGQLATKISGNLKTILQNYLRRIK